MTYVTRFKATFCNRWKASKSYIIAISFLKAAAVLALILKNQNFAYWFSIHKMAVIGRFLGPCYLLDLILPKFSPEIVWNKFEEFEFS